MKIFGINSNSSKEIKASFAYMMCSILQKTISFFTLPFFTRILTTEEYAQCILYSSWSSIITIFITLNLAYGPFSKAMIKYKDKRYEYISSLQSVFIILAIIFVLIYYPLRNYFNLLFELSTEIIMVMVADILFQNIILLWYGKNRFEFNYIKVVVLTISISIISTILAFTFVNLSDEKGLARIIGYAAPNIVFGFVIMIINYIKGKNFYRKEYWKYSLGYGLPLIVYYISQYVFNTSDKIMISHLSDSNSVAMYGMANNLAFILIFVLNAINNSYVPWVYNKIEDNKPSDNKKVSICISIILSLMLLCIIWFAPELILMLGGEKYLPCIYAVGPITICILLLFYSQLFINIEFYYEIKNKLVYASIGAAIANVVLNYIFIPVFGYIAASYTTLISYFIFVFSNFISVKDRKVIYDLYDFKILAIVLITFVSISFVGILLYNYLVIRIIITIMVLGILIIYRNFFIQNLVIFKEKHD